MWTERAGLRTALAVSVLLNLFLFGLIGGHLYLDRATARPDRVLIPSTRLDALPAAERSRYAAAMEAHKAAIAAARRDDQVARDALRAELAASVFDVGKVKAAFAAFRRARAVLQEEVQSAIADGVATLPAPSRAALVAH